MYTIKIDDRLGDLLNKHNINPENALREYAIMELLNKKEKYHQEIKRFETKYNGNFQTIEKNTHGKKEEEQFDIEEDLMDWEFAITSFESINNYLKELV